MEISNGFHSLGNIVSSFDSLFSLLLPSIAVSFAFMSRKELLVTIVALCLSHLACISTLKYITGSTVLGVVEVSLELCRDLDGKDMTL